MWLNVSSSTKTSVSAFSNHSSPCRLSMGCWWIYKVSFEVSEMCSMGVNEVLYRGQSDTSYMWSPSNISVCKMSFGSFVGVREVLYWCHWGAMVGAAIMRLVSTNWVPLGNIQAERESQSEAVGGGSVSVMTWLYGMVLGLPFTCNLVKATVLWGCEGIYQIAKYQDQCC